jgi:hypothetical protein
MAAENFMCKTLINIGPDGRLYDCDFNQTLGLTVLGCNPGHIMVLIVTLFPKGLSLQVYIVSGALQVRDHPEWVH